MTEIIKPAEHHQRIRALEDEVELLHQQQDTQTQLMGQIVEQLKSLTRSVAKMAGL